MTTNAPKESGPAKAGSRIRLGGILAFVGIAAYGGMFLSFGIVDEDVFEMIGGVGVILAAIGVLLVTFGLAPSG